MPLSTNTYGYVIDPLFSFCDQGGKTIANGYVRVFRAGTSTPVLTYRNYDGAFNAETIELDNSGRTMTKVIASKGDLYKVCVYDAEHSQEDPILTVDKVAVIGASVNATNIVQGLNDVEGSGWIKSVSADDTAEVSLDPTGVSDHVETFAQFASHDQYKVPLVKDDGSQADAKLGHLMLNTLQAMSILDSVNSASGTDYVVLLVGGNPKRISVEDLLELTAQNTLAGNVAQEFDTSSSYKIGEKVTYNGKRYFFKSNHTAGSWNPGHVYEDKYLASTTLIKEIFSSASTIYFGNFKAGDSVHFSFSSSDWVNTSGSAAVVIVCFKSDGGYAYYKTYTNRTALLANGFDLLVPSNSLYVSLTLRVDVGYSVVAEAKNNGAVSLYGYVGDVQGDDLFEMGNISMSGSGNSYSASTTRVRTKTAFKAYAGDKIVADAGVSFYVNTRPIGTNTWNPVGWNSGEFIVDSDCDICLLFRLSTETTTSVSEICSKFVIYSSRSSFTAASRVVKMFNAEPEFTEIKKNLAFTGDGNSIKRVSFNVVGGKIYKFNIPAFSAVGVTNLYILYSLDFGSDSLIYYRRLKTDDSVNAGTLYLYIPIGITSVRFSLRAAVGENVVISVSEYERQSPPVVNTPVVRNVNHRGCLYAVENTIPAYILSAAYGYNIVETDVRVTSDGKFVCLHDDTVDSLSNGTGAISSMTLAQAKALSFAKTRPSYFSSTKIATLSEVLAICKQLGLKLYVDIKIGATYAEAIADEVNSFGMIDEVSFARGDKAALLAIKTKYPAARVGYLAGDITSEIVSDILSLSTDEGHRDIFIDSNKDVITSAGLALAEAENIPVELWVKDDIDFTASQSVSGVTSNAVLPPSILAAENVFANVMQTT